MNPRPFTSLKNLWPFLKPYTWSLVGTGIALVIAAGMLLGFGAGLRFLIDEGFNHHNPKLLDQAVLSMGAVIAVLAAASYARSFLTSWVGEQVLHDIRQTVFRHLLKLGAAFFDQNRVGELSSRLTADTALVQVVVGGAASTALRHVLQIIGGIIMLVSCSLKLSLVVLIVIPISILPLVIFGRQVRSKSKQAQVGLASVGAFAEEIFSAIRVTQALGAEEWAAQQMQVLGGEALATAKSRIKARSFLVTCVIALVFTAVAVLFWMGGHAVIEGSLTAGQLSAFVFYAVVVAGSCGALSEIMGDVQRANGALERLAELLHLEPAVKISSICSRLPKPIKGKITFESISFAYPSRPEQEVLKDVTIHIESGETVAIIGPSGSGKTTLLNLLLRFYSPQQGAIFVDDVDIKETSLQDLRQHIGVVMQDPQLLSGTVNYNIRFNRTDVGPEVVIKAAKESQASGFIQQLPSQFLTHIGEKGTQLSGGQKQRIALARALLNDPPILFLDEATNAIDRQSESLIQESLLARRFGKTTIIIGHHHSSIQHADRIIVLNQGLIEAIGTSTELAATNKFYQKLLNEPE